MHRLFLWDIDGTLLLSHGVSRDAFHDAVHEVLGIRIDDDGLSFAGKTDQQIARELLTRHGVADDEIRAVMRQVLRRFGPAFTQRKAELQQRGEVLPGVRQVLEACDDSAVLNTVLTGNLAVNAVLKLDAFRLTPFFDLELGGYGSDCEDRLDLVDVVLERLEKRSLHFEDEQIWIIGDTPADFATARENDVRCLLVATGPYSYDDLSSLEPDAVLSDLSDLAAFADAVGLYRGR